MRNPLTIARKLIAHIGEHPRSTQWPAARKKWIDLHPTCAACGSTKDCEVHHMVPFSVKPELELVDTNFITLCESMGVEHHLHVGHCPHGDTPSWKKFNPDVEADAAAMLKAKG